MLKFVVVSSVEYPNKSTILCYFCGRFKYHNESKLKQSFISDLKNQNNFEILSFETA